ncbi:hypothetical protein L3Q82_018384 [Scortum barcoo]|uniref:Uncharacterized protein n=1 Tax=Scortum barcoo TaxID=214431 RepID=A0ACB8VJ58_9TELE|nr:hypothetical protein L3Q82_018384 [Scortum barcoo]
MPPGRLPREVFQACPTGRRPWEDPGHAGETMSLSWPGNASGSPPEELEEVSGIFITDSPPEVLLLLGISEASYFCYPVNTFRRDLIGCCRSGSYPDESRWEADSP